MSTNKLTWIVISVVAIAVVTYYAFYKDYDTKQETTETPKEARTEIINTLADKYGAINLKDISEKFTISLQEEIVEAEKLVVFEASLDDIYKKDKKTFVRFAPAIFSYGSNLYYDLECSTDLEELKKDSPRNIFSDNYAVVARISNISKMFLSIRGEPGDEEGIVDLNEEPSDIRLLTGNCVEVVKLPDYF